jgi:hypothetical protein
MSVQKVVARRKNMVHKTIYLTEQQSVALRRISRETGISRSTLIREGISSLLRKRKHGRCTFRQF